VMDIEHSEGRGDGTSRVARKDARQLDHKVQSIRTHEALMKDSASVAPP